VFLIPVVVICVEGACEAAAFWIVNAVGASAALAIINVQIVDKDGNTRKVFEAEREPDSSRVQDKKDEYDKLGIEREFYDLNDNLQPP
jgi:hypothetical protein